MELEEEGHEHSHHAVDQVTHLDHQVLEEQLLVLSSTVEVVSVHFPLDAHHEVITHGDGHIVGCYQHIY